MAVVMIALMTTQAASLRRIIPVLRKDKTIEVTYQSSYKRQRVG